MNKYANDKWAAKIDKYGWMMQRSMRDFFKLGVSKVFRQEGRNGVFFGVVGTSEAWVSILIDGLGFLIDGIGSFCSGEESV